MSLFAWMLREEYRLHARLFGGGRFLAFPVLIVLLVAASTWLLVETGVDSGAVLAGVHALVVFFGLQVGTIGLAGRDAMRDVLGDVTLLVFSARTLPLSLRRVLGTFLVKDLVYYVILFVTPLVVGLVPVVVAGDGTLASVPLLWVSVGGTFALGAAASLTATGLAGRFRLAPLAIGLGLAALFIAGIDLVQFTPYVVFGDPRLVTILTGFAPTVALGIIAPFAFAPDSGGNRQVRRVTRDTYARGRAFLGGDATASLTVRPLLEVVRSSGSVWKVAFSMGVLFAVAALLLDRVAVATALEPSAGLAFGALLGLGSFTTYNWVTSLDNPREYLRYPATFADVLGGKLRAYLVLTIPAGLVYLALAAIWYPPADLAIGIVVFPLVAVYVFGLTAYLTGLAPNELLFDTPLFAVFGAGLAVLAVPLLVLSLAAGRYPTASPVIAIALAVGAAALGAWLVRRSGPRWDERLRRAN